IGYMATGVGFLVGYGSAFLGGRGQTNGVLCGIIALLSMFGGKMMAVRIGLPAAIRHEIAQMPEAQGKTSAQIDAAAAGAMASVTFADLADATKDNLDIIDIVFAVIGVAAAYQIGSGARRTRPQYAPPAGAIAPGGPVQPGPAGPMASSLGPAAPPTTSQTFQEPPPPPGQP
ncbi:MAG TPA: hypothetical protein VMI31_02635, partial [Fimbriimonadaceae bacterium]|nr:hypothetical protein [Fimbriimonadaceae bacterium]